MSQILNRVRDVDASDSEAVKEALNAFFQNLLKYKDIDCTRWLRALLTVINRFPRYCGTHRPTIESYLTHFLTSNNFFNVIEAAKCAHAVQQVRPAQEKAATAKSCWRDHMIALCDAAHKLIDALFAKNAGMYANQRNQKKTVHVPASSSLQEALSGIDSLSGSHESAVNKTTILNTRLRNVLVFIQAILVEVYPVAKPIQPQLILAVILQALSAPGSEDSANVTAIKIQALRTLDALVACLGSNLIPFSALVFRFVMQTLKWSSDNTSEETSKVRVVAYSSLGKWLDCLHVHRPADGRARAWHDELTTHIVSDVTPPKHVMQLTVNAQPMKNLSKKARKRLANTMLKESSIASHMPGEKNKHNLSEKANDEVAVAALECAETFLSVCGIFLKTTTLKQFQELLVRECFALHDHASARAMCLLRALEACRTSGSLKVPPPTQYCLQLYSYLVNSPQREVSKFCSQALMDIRLHLHCSPASLSFSLGEQSQKQKDKEEGRKRVSERNRVVLEKLLGIDWMNSENPTAETVITIPDEPTSKRPRVQTEVSETTENVSISSDSVHSVEMSSDSDGESIIEGVELVIEPNDSIEEVVVFEPVIAEHLNTSDSGIHNESTQVVVTHDEPAIVSLADEPTQGIKDLAIHDEPAQADPKIKNANEIVAETNKDDFEVEKIMETPNSLDIHEAKTQIPLPNSDTIDGKSPLSMEVVYDYPNTGNEKITVLEKIDDENLPSTNDTDDIQITCGQVVKNSQEADTDKSKDVVEEIQKDIVEIPKVNGIDKSLETANGEVAIDEVEIASKITPNDKEITVEDMLADFVDEVNETPA